MALPNTKYTVPLNYKTHSFGYSSLRAKRGNPEFNCIISGLPQAIALAKTGKIKFFDSKSISYSRGFTLIELLVTIGIFTMIMSVVLVNHRSFNIRADFTNTVENVYLTLREVQVYGAGGKSAGDDLCGTPASSFNCAYGVRFSSATGPNGSYVIFVDKNENRIYDAGAIAGELIQTIPLGSGTTITSLTCITSSGSGPCGSSGASVSFKRPSPDAFIAEFASPVNSNYGIEVTISNGIKTAKVVISEAGQMSIQ